MIERAILGEHPIFVVPAYRLNNTGELIFYAVLGVLAGLASVVFNEGLLRLRSLSMKQRVIPQWVSRTDTSRLLGIITMHDIAERLASEAESTNVSNPDQV